LPVTTSLAATLVTTLAVMPDAVRLQMIK
jgi:hypothetical protein